VNPIRFEPPVKPDFFATLKQRVNAYFKDSGKSKNANGYMVLKTIIMFTIFLVPYGFILSGMFTSGWFVVLMYTIMGVGTTGIGLAVMHDAVHGAYSKSPVINKILSLSMNLIGGSPLNWKIQHNVLHHTYPNIDGYDDDITPKFVLRFSPHTELKEYHKYQYIYAWFLYGLTTLSWVIAKDINQLTKYNNQGLIRKVGSNYGKALTFIVISKLVYITYTLILPIIFGGVGWGFVLFGFILMHLIAGIMMGLVFQPAHLMEDLKFPLPDNQGKMHNNWAAHQMYTTANFANKNAFITWFVGGLNFQIEHHLFPNICHVHYPKLSLIVKKTASEFDLPYYSQQSFSMALASHARTLKKLGRPLEYSPS